MRIKEREHVMLIMEYLGLFQEQFEYSFGKMEHAKSRALGDGKLLPIIFHFFCTLAVAGCFQSCPRFIEILRLTHIIVKDDTVYIQSTGYTAKVLLGLMMADRLQVIEGLRRQERELIGYTEIDVNTLKEEDRTCIICTETLGQSNADGIKEDPIKLIICCQRIFGKNCMKKWLDEEATYPDMPNDSCPMCRYVFPLSFLDKLMDLDSQDDDGEEHVANAEPREVEEEHEAQIEVMEVDESQDQPLEIHLDNDQYEGQPDGYRLISPSPDL